MMVVLFHARLDFSHHFRKKKKSERELTQHQKYTDADGGQWSIKTSTQSLLDDAALEVKA